MVATLTEGLGAIFAAADANGGDIAAAWRANGKVTTLKNATRQYKKHCARRPKRAAAKRTAKPAVARKPSEKKELRLPSRFVEEAAASASLYSGGPPGEPRRLRTRGCETWRVYRCWSSVLKSRRARNESKF